MNKESVKKMFNIGTILFFVALIVIIIANKLYLDIIYILPITFMGLIFALSSNYLNKNKL